MTVILAAFMLALVSCSPRAGKTAEENPYRDFPSCQAPSVYTERAEILDYMCSHFWDKYLAGDGPTDSLAILGVLRPDVEQSLANYIGMLDMIPMDKAQKSLGGLFEAVELKQDSQQDSSLFFLRFTELLARYLYDPNSPLRSEDFFLPVARGLAASRHTRDDMRPGYAYQAQMCAINQYGQKVPDFNFKDISGRSHHLYEVKGENILLFFSNPGCPACREIMDELGSLGCLDELIGSGRLAVVSMYIDDELDEWRAYEPNYPRNWVRGYNYDKTIREEQIFDIRAIPSLYLLDSDFRVLMKDVPTDRVLNYLDRMTQQQ